MSILRPQAAWIFLALVLVPTVVGAQCIEETLLVVSQDDNIIREVSLDDLSVGLTHAMIGDPGSTIDGFVGIEASTIEIVNSAGTIYPPGTVFVLVRQNGFPAPFLATIDLDANIVNNLIGSTFVDFTGLTFNEMGEVHSVSRNTANPPRAFCELNIDTGAPNDVCQLPNGDAGEAIAFHAGLNQFFHASGTQDVVFETYEPEGGPGIPCNNTTAVNITGTSLEDGQVTALCYRPATSTFLWAQADGPDSTLIFEVTETGEPTLLGSLDFSVKGLAVAEESVPCPTDLFKRGDANGDGNFQGLSDGVFILNFQFIPGSAPPPCMDAADVNDDGNFSGLVDGLAVLNFQFVPGSPPPPPPGPTVCGEDPTADNLDCLSPPCP